MSFECAWAAFRSPEARCTGARPWPARTSLMARNRRQRYVELTVAEALPTDAISSTAASMNEAIRARNFTWLTSAGVSRDFSEESVRLELRFVSAGVDVTWLPSRAASGYTTQRMDDPVAAYSWIELDPVMDAYCISVAV